MSSTRPGGGCGEASEVAIAVLHGALKVGLADSPEVDTLDDPYRMPQMPEGEGGEARGRLSCSRVDLTLVAEGPDGPVTFAFRVVGVEEFEVESSQHFLVVQRTARLAGSIRREAAYEAPVF